MKKILYISNPASIHDQKWITFFALKNEFSLFVIYEKQNKINYETLNVYSSLGINVLNPIDKFSITSPFKTIKSFVTISRILKNNNIDIVHILFATPHALWCKYINCKLIITTRGSDVLQVLPSLKKGTGLKKIYYQWLFNLFKKAFKKANLITCTSIKQQRKLKKLFNLNMTYLIRTGVNVNKIIKQTNQEKLPSELVGKKFVFSPRFFSPIYNIELQLKAIELLPKSILKKYSFVFIRGLQHDKRYKKMIINWLQKLRQSVNLNFYVYDHLDQEKLWTIFNFSSLVIHTPISDGTPNSALEAMAAKRPLILPRIGYDKDLFDNACFYISENSPQLLADLIIKAISDYPQELLVNAFENVNKYGKREVEMMKLYSFYKSLI